ncbi:hypothetical protein BDF14DRAFT_1748969 [Spinellus fusiger]|nr:hypothetical protein BDF14DRAFT_1748969 [Spinellus fusiger]
MYDTEDLQLTDYIHPTSGYVEETQDKLSSHEPLFTSAEAPSSHNIPSTLFDSSDDETIPKDWLESTNQFRKHSVAADGADFSSIFTTTATTPFAAPSTMSNAMDGTSPWRRLSAPNTAQNETCSLCLCQKSNILAPRQNCGHIICQSCLSTVPYSLFLHSACPVCSNRTQKDTTKHYQTLSEASHPVANVLSFKQQQSKVFPQKSIIETAQPTALLSSIVPNYPSPLPLPVSVTTPTSTVTSTSTPSDLLATSYSYPCLKLSNIPWDVSQNDIRAFFCQCRMPSPSVYAQSIHIMMDRTTGKTLSDAYIEFATVVDLRRAIETRNQKPLKGRIVTATECTQDELLSIVFSKWRGKFCGISAIPPASDVVKSMSTAAGGGGVNCPPFITREEINSLLVVCKNYKLHFSRKCAERPFENIISVITKYPWHQSYLISTMHRDHIFEMLKLSIESLRTHLSKDYVHIDSSLLERVTRTGLMCPAFTERQKLTLLQNARIECPADIYHLLNNMIIFLLSLVHLTPSNK